MAGFEINTLNTSRSLWVFRNIALSGKVKNNLIKRENTFFLGLCTLNSANINQKVSNEIDVFSSIAPPEREKTSF